MSRMRIRWTVLLTLVVLLATAGGLAIGAELSIDDLGHSQLAPSSAAPLLAPITEVGRKGWDCMPEKAARAKTARAAELPPSDS
jgi:hypothetical protein